MTKTGPKSAAIDVLRVRTAYPVPGTPGHEEYLNQLARYLDELLDKGRDPQSGGSLPAK